MSSRHRRGRSSTWSRKLRRFRVFRILHEDRPFAYMFGAAVVVVGLILLSIPKSIRVTPLGFSRGEVKVSVVDLVQAWSLERAARAAAAEGDNEGALQAWRSAIVNNPADPALLRGALTFLWPRTNAPGVHLPFVAQTASWLAALARTNQADLVLAADLLEKYSYPQGSLELLSEVAPGNSDLVDRARARSLFTMGRYTEFEALWRTHREQWADDPKLSVYLDAWRFGFEDQSASIGAGLRLKKVLGENTAQALLAARLLHQVGVRRGTVEDVALALKRLEIGGAATVPQHAQLWQLMAASGRLEEARSLARGFREPPRDPAAAQILVETLKQLELTREALRFLESSVAGYGTAIGVWRVYLDLLVEAENWNEARRVSANARVLCSRQDALFCESLFADYRVAQGQGRTNDAGSVVRDLVDLKSTDVAAVTRVTARLRADGWAAQALTILGNHETVFANSAVFWSEYFQVGRVLRDVSILRRAVAELLRINPSSPLWANNRAALLLITGENASEALQLTFDGLSRQPESLALNINHAIALFMNGRVGEAARILGGIDVRRLEPDAAASFHLAMAEVRAAQTRPDEAAKEAALVDRSRLFPHQIERLERVRKSAPGPGP